MPAHYALVEDVLRKLDQNPERNQAAGGNGRFDPAHLESRIRSVSREFDRATGTPHRMRRVGSPNEPRTWDYHDARRKYPLRVDLNQRSIVPFDPDEGDRLEVRVGRDSWRDVTDAEGSQWTLEHSSGYLRVFRRLLRRLWWESPDDRYIRTTYRYGSLGGSFDRGGETPLESEIADDATTLDVADIARLPPSGGFAATVGGEEYVEVEAVDHETGELDVRRGVNGTDATTHGAGATVHYCPEDIRDAVAGKAAVEGVLKDDSQLGMPDDGQLTDRETKKKTFESEWDDTCARYSRVRRI